MKGLLRRERALCFGGACYTTTMVAITPRHVGELSRLHHLLHVVAYPALGNRVIRSPGADHLTVDYPHLAGDEVEGRLAAGCGAQGFFVIAWGEPGVVATIYEPGELLRPTAEVLAEICEKRPELEPVAARVLDFFVSTGAVDVASAGYWSTRGLSSHPDVTRVGDDQPLAWFGRELATAVAWVMSPSSPLAGIPIALRELALHLFTASQSSRYTLTAAEGALLYEAQREHSPDIAGLGRLADAARRLGLARVDWTPSPAALRALLPPPPPAVAATLDAVTLDLHYAVATGDVASVRALLEAGADPNAVGWEGEFGAEAFRPLNLAFEALAVSEGTIYGEVILVLLRHGADPLRAWRIESLFNFATGGLGNGGKVGPAIFATAWRCSADAFVDHVVQSEAYTGNLVEMLLASDVAFDDPERVGRIAAKLHACGEAAMLKRFLARARAGAAPG